MGCGWSDAWGGEVKGGESGGGCKWVDPEDEGKSKDSGDGGGISWLEFMEDGGG